MASAGKTGYHGSVAKSSSNGAKMRCNDTSTSMLATTKTKLASEIFGQNMGSSNGLWEPMSIAPGLAALGHGGSVRQHARELMSRSRKRALTVGINYLNLRQGRLAGCINDSETFVSLLMDEWGFDTSEIRQLRDDRPQQLPTRQNIVDDLHWLTSGAQEGDHLFFHYSGHGGQQVDTSGDEADGFDETIIPCDYLQSGQITDDEMRKLLVLPLPSAVRLTVILDCCHSGTCLDLSYRVVLSANDRKCEVQKVSSPRTTSEADVVMISGCKDNQTSADIQAGSAGNKNAAGAMTTAFKAVVMKDPHMTYHGLLSEIRRWLRSHGFQQVPQLCSEQLLNLNECFMPEAEPADVTPAPRPVPSSRRAVSIGINYIGHSRGRLAGCIHDSDTMIDIMKSVFGFHDPQICQLRDDRADQLPTKANILSALRWLASGATPGDEMFLHYSGHGGTRDDWSGDELDGKDETLIPCDYQTSGDITDDELYESLVSGLPRGCRMWVILDCCHSGTALDLQFKAKLTPDGKGATFTMASVGKARHTRANVIMISGCKDEQTSADVSAGQLGQNAASGAMTSAFAHVIRDNHNISCKGLLHRMQQYLRSNGFRQVPQMSSEQFVSLDSPFVSYEERKRSRKPLGRPQQAAGVLSPVKGESSHIAAVAEYRMPTLHVSARINRLEEELAKLRLG
eukprot:gnl/TRDRNA2_/TRDRNA2_130187_c0_seq1.p1 gnl/TRDRNA2_/TRDRNA2_130187_c0~~gnl/TRDRNA2_/TRDRNA2_130187_c0_seq1.p1  ORF type:complete len:691 (+),score=104.16 gnl/TRDRNA2_/TRDRNA2_130187_c0_seq1:30-2075(+)